MAVKEKPLFYITGHGRSGTNYMAELFTHLGYPVGKQSGARCGQSHNFPQHWPPTLIKENYQYLIQVVRDPWKVLESVHLATYSLAFQNTKKLPEIGAGTRDWAKVTIDQNIKSVVLWNRAIAEAKPDLLVKVEEAEEVCTKWLNSIGLEVRLSKSPPRKDVNKRQTGGWHLREKVPWDKASKECIKMFKEHCQIYGYSNEAPSG